MANEITDLTKLIVPPVFTKWVIDHLNDTNNLLQSGILSQPQGIDLTAPGVTVQIPYIKAEKHLPDPWTDQDNKTSHSVGASSMFGMKLYQTLTYGSTKLSTIISGAPTQSAIASAMAEGWTAGNMYALIKLLSGVFSVEDIAAAKKIDMTAISPTNSDFNSTGWLASRTLMGDKANVLTGIAVNSATEAMMTQEDLKDHGSTISSDVAPNGTFHGMIITVDDQIPLDISDPKKPKSTAYIFSRGAVAFDRTKMLENGGTSYVSQDSIMTMNVQGTSVKKGWQPAKANFATVDEMTSANAWEVPEGRDVRDIGVVAYTHTVDPIFAKGLIAAQKKASDGNSGVENKGDSGKKE